MKTVLHMTNVFCALTVVECIPELQLLQVVFAHKTYAPILDLISSNVTDSPTSLTYEHFINAPRSMPNAGMLNMYNLGAHLREVYNEFLGGIYMEKTMKMQTADYPLSMMSGQLVNAGLWPPTEIQKWNNDINWQPIPTDYVSMCKDTLLLGMYCPSFASETMKVLNMDQVRATIKDHSTLFEALSRYTGMEISQPSQVALLYAVLETQADLNQTLPYWASDVFPHGEMYNVSLLEYDLLSQTLLQKQLNGGTILKEILTNSLSYISGKISKKRKLMMYSGNERNIIGVLKSLDLWSPHIPNEAASIIFEMYFDNETETYGMKINYYTGVEGETIPLKLNNCTKICPMKIFLDSIFDLLPQNEHTLCHWKKIEFADQHNFVIIDSAMYSSTTSYKLKSIMISLLLIVTLFIF
ncbi:venom acid phosphatase Acph-1 [Megachile rotundata]|uniref:venom acid phosphatase Acph-1 n=1 Tax=Megachile rotundata TaxID=143995 RepID=UPI000258EB14|nr:PREDICTED: venom acid phosphatase Acph-1-like [Megachile rotundata]